jgi:hypothetical protein
VGHQKSIQSFIRGGFIVLNHRKEEFVVFKEGSTQTAEVLAQVKKFGYAPAQKIRIYGEEFEVLSDPFTNVDGIAIQVRSQRTAAVRVLQLPATIVQRKTGHKAA